jgi:Ni/Co efflux regulator RcnB
MYSFKKALVLSLVTVGFMAGSLAATVSPAEARWERRCHRVWRHGHKVTRCHRVWVGSHSRHYH